MLRGFQSIGSAENWSIEKRMIRLFTQDKATVEIASWADGVVRTRFFPEGCPYGNATWALVQKVPSHDAPEFLASPTGDERMLFFHIGKLSVKIELSPIRITFLDAGGKVLSRESASGGLARRRAAVCCTKEMPAGERFYGFGEKTGPLDKRGKRLEMWNLDVHPHTPTTDPLYQSIPFVLVRRADHATFYGIFLNNMFRSFFDLGKGTPAELHGVPGEWSFGADAGDLDYFFIYGPRPEDVLRRYTKLTGKMPLPPRWALGYHQCRWSYPSAARVREIANEFRRRDIPCDAIWLDIDYMNGYRVFTWNDQRFPEPGQLTQDLAKNGFRIVTIIDPGVKVDDEFDYPVYHEGLKGGFFVTYPSGELCTGEVWPGLAAFPDFAQARVRQWWGEKLNVLVGNGVAGIWNDMNEPAVLRKGGAATTLPEHAIHVDDESDIGSSYGHDGCSNFGFVEKEGDEIERTSRVRLHAEVHNAYGLLMARATFEGLKRLQSKERPFVLTRAGFAGIQRYAAVWTGDNASWWEHLATAIPMCLNIGLSGVPFVGVDIGGFEGDATGELYARWIELGAFLPFCRTHSAINTRHQEPWSFGGQVEQIARRYLKLRYRLMPYLYSVFWEASQNGKPIMRPLVFEYPDDERAASVGTEFLIGSWLLVAPVIEENVQSRMVYLPKGDWYHWWTGRLFKGPGEYIVGAPLEELPLFVRAGAVIPVGPEISFSDQRPLDPLRFLVWPASAEASPLLDAPKDLKPVQTGSDLGFAPSEFLFYEDDGKSMDFCDGLFSLRSLSCETRSDGKVLIRIGTRDGRFEPGPRTVEIEVREHDDSILKRYELGSKPSVLSFTDTKEGLEIWISEARSPIVRKL